eukprot:185761-Rhodomonas_salina.2
MQFSDTRSAYRKCGTGIGYLLREEPCGTGVGYGLPASASASTAISASGTPLSPTSAVPNTPGQYQLCSTTPVQSVARYSAVPYAAAVGNAQYHTRVSTTRSGLGTPWVSTSQGVVLRAVLSQYRTRRSRRIAAHAMAVLQSA